MPESTLDELEQYRRWLQRRLEFWSARAKWRDNGAPKVNRREAVRKVHETMTALQTLHAYVLARNAESVLEGVHHVGPK